MLGLRSFSLAQSGLKMARVLPQKQVTAVIASSSLAKSAPLRSPVSRLFPSSSSSAVVPLSRSFSAASSSPSSAAKPAIPTINLQPAWESEAGKRAVAKEIAHACETIGFFTIVGHGVPKADMDAAWNACIKYFDLPASDKRKIPMTEDYPYGYSGYLEENLSAGYGAVTLPDLKESFCIGPYNPAALMPAQLWPDQPAELKVHLGQYYRHMEDLADRLLRLMALALDLDEGFFAPKISHHRSALRALNYPELKDEPVPGQIRAGEHTDYGTVTILKQDLTGGLQVKNIKGEWCDVVPTPDSFIINLGDLMSRWTNDKWVSTRHRVVNPPSKARRQSIAFFHNLNHDQNVACIPTCTGPANPPKYPDILAWELLMQKHLASVGQAPSQQPQKKE